MKDFINSSALTKLLANIFVFLVLVCALGIAAYDTLNGATVNPYVATLIGAGLSYAVNILGMHIGGVQALQAQQSNASTTAAVVAAAASPAHAENAQGANMPPAA